MKLSYECSDLIEELIKDMKEYGANKEFVVWFEFFEKYKTEFVVNYDFIVEDMPVEKYEVSKNERIALMPAKELLELLIEQNSII